MNLLSTNWVSIFFINFFIFLSTILSLHAQIDSLKTKRIKGISNNIYFGGGLGLQFGSYTLLQASPLIGYKLTNKLSIGLQFSYAYIHDKINKYETSLYGGSFFSRYIISNLFFLHSEYDILNLEVYKPPLYSKERINVDAILIGGGLSQPVGTSSSINIIFLWDILENRYYPYKNPILRGGINVGF